MDGRRVCRYIGLVLLVPASVSCCITVGWTNYMRNMQVQNKAPFCQLHSGTLSGTWSSATTQYHPVLTAASLQFGSPASKTESRCYTWPLLLTMCFHCYFLSPVHKTIRTHAASTHCCASHQTFKQERSQSQQRAAPHSTTGASSVLSPLSQNHF